MEGKSGKLSCERDRIDSCLIDCALNIDWRKEKRLGYWGRRQTGSLSKKDVQKGWKEGVAVVKEGASLPGRKRVN
jgi:hypothetical protein